MKKKDLQSNDIEREKKKKKKKPKKQKTQVNLISKKVRKKTRNCLRSHNFKDNF